MKTEESTIDRSDRTAKEWWNGWSEKFQTEYGGDGSEIGIAFGPGVPIGEDFGLLDDLDGTRVIELGCGGAQFGLGIATHGAEVTGVDISEEQLEYARKLADEHGEEIDLVETTVTDMPMIEGEAYELAVSAFAFQWVEDLKACFEEAHRVLVPGGRLVFSVDHPFYRILDPETGDIATSYFDGEPRREYSEKIDAELVIYRRRVSDIVNALIDAGFTIEELCEPGFDDPDEYDSEYGMFRPERMATFPPTLVVAAVKSD